MMVCSLRRMSVLLTPLAMVLVAAACGDDGIDNGPAGVGLVRIVHLSPEPTPNVDVLVNGEGVNVTDVPFGDSTSFFEFPANSYDFDVIPTGGTVDDAVIRLEDFEVGVDEGFTFVAWGTLDDGTLPALAIEEDFAELPEDTLQLRAVHVAEGVDTVDVYAVAVSDDTQLFGGLEEGTSQVLALPLEVVPEVDPVPVILDANQDGSGDATFDVPADLFEDGAFVTVYAVDDGGLALFAHTREDARDLARIDPD